MALYYEDEIEADRDFMNKLADSLEIYVSQVEKYVIIPSLSENDFTKATKKVRKLIKKLRKGDTSVFDPERYYEVIGRIGSGFNG